MSILIFYQTLILGYYVFRQVCLVKVTFLPILDFKINKTLGVELKTLGIEVKTLGVEVKTLGVEVKTLG
ncbi:MAG: hypothetical protein LBC20_07015, partial [Planctomycetaceae bacterium]|nr:hypothetical protein [Planctomycetaceae bacterium]